MLGKKKKNKTRIVKFKVAKCKFKRDKEGFFSLLKWRKSLAEEGRTESFVSKCVLC